MTNHNPSNHDYSTSRERLRANIDVPTVDDPIFKAPWPWLERFGVLIYRFWHPSCSFWVATCTFLPLTLSCSPRNRKLWVDLKANETGNRVRKFFGLPDME